MRRCRPIPHISVALLLVAGPSASSARALDVDSQGGITLWISYDNLDAGGENSIESIVSEAASKGGEGIVELSCDLQNQARENHFANIVSKDSHDAASTKSPGSCDEVSVCKARHKLEGDLQRLAEYIYEATHGAHFLKQVYVHDQGQEWETADVRWNMSESAVAYTSNGWSADATATQGGWNKGPDEHVALNSGWRTCIHDVLFHELGHYLYDLPDRYAPQIIGGCFNEQPVPVVVPGPVVVTGGDVNTTMSWTFPHRFTDSTSGCLPVEYKIPKTETEPEQHIIDDCLKPGEPGPDYRVGTHQCTAVPISRDEWSKLRVTHLDLEGEDVHAEGDFSLPCLEGATWAECMRPFNPPVFVKSPNPGTVLLLDRSGSMRVEHEGMPASQWVQEAAWAVYHETVANNDAGAYLGSYLYNTDVEPQFAYDLYDASDDPTGVPFKVAELGTNITKALKEAIDTLEAQHPGDGPVGGQIFLYSDGRHTTGPPPWAEVERASNLGIRIFAFESGDADVETLQQIGDITSGDTVTASEPGSGAELKLDIAREVLVSEGYTSVYSHKGPVTGDGLDGAGHYADTFEVPMGSRDMLFYIFLETHNAAALSVKLTHSSGGQAQVVVDAIQMKGRFKGVRVRDVEAGAWSFTIDRLGGALAAGDNIEIVAYVLNPELDVDSWVEAHANPDVRIVRARITYRYPLANVRGTVRVYDGAKLISVFDGVRLATAVGMIDGRGPDGRPNDGIYTAGIDLKRFRSHPARKDVKKVRVDVEFEVDRGALPAPSVPYEPGAQYGMVVADYKQISRQTFVAHSTTIEPLHAKKRRRPVISRITPRPPRVVRPGARGVLHVTVLNALPLKDLTRVSLGQGVDAAVVRVSPFKKRFGATLQIAYKSSRSATVGARELALQFGKIILRKRGAFRVSGRPLPAARRPPPDRRRQTPR